MSKRWALRSEESGTYLESITSAGWPLMTSDLKRAKKFRTKKEAQQCPATSFPWSVISPVRIDT